MDGPSHPPITLARNCAHGARGVWMQLPLLYTLAITAGYSTQAIFKGLWMLLAMVLAVHAGHHLGVTCWEQPVTPDTRFASDLPLPPAPPASLLLSFSLTALTSQGINGTHTSLTAPTEATNPASHLILTAAGAERFVTTQPKGLGGCFTASNRPRSLWR